MNILAKLYNTRTVRIIAFVPNYPHDVQAIYVDADGKVDSCYIEHLTIIDPEYELEQPHASQIREWGDR